MQIVIVGAPFEEQTLYGPFKDFDEASDFADTVKNDYTWIVELVPAKDRIET